MLPILVQRARGHHLISAIRRSGNGNYPTKSIFPRDAAQKSLQSRNSAHLYAIEMTMSLFLCTWKVRFIGARALLCARCQRSKNHRISPTVSAAKCFQDDLAGYLRRPREIATTYPELQRREHWLKSLEIRTPRTPPRIGSRFPSSRISAHLSREIEAPICNDDIQTRQSAQKSVVCSDCGSWPCPQPTWLGPWRGRESTRGIELEAYLLELGAYLLRSCVSRHFERMREDEGNKLLRDPMAAFMYSEDGAGDGAASVWCPCRSGKSSQ